ncbi:MULTISPECIES: hypothetical protein [unclassified Schlesneria]|uniref:hypothetical protein n=1 Tax=Schlesneria TaxID=656899 RepID=UPI0035A06C87
MNTTEYLADTNFSNSEPLTEVPLFFERTAGSSLEPIEVSGDLEPGEAQFRRDFQARWWPGDMQVYTPPAKG